MKESASEEWLRLLKGGFAFETAPFASHPLDAQRAERMFFVAQRAGISNQDIEHAARLWLEKNGCNAEFIDDQINQVRRVLNRYSLKKTAIRRILVFWNSVEDFVVDRTDRLVAALDPRLSTNRLADFMTQHYLAAEGSAREKLEYATRPKRNPYRATFAGDGTRGTFIWTCGHNPWIEARLCTDIKVWTNEDVNEVVTWAKDSAQPSRR